MFCLEKTLLLQSHSHLRQFPVAEYCVAFQRIYPAGSKIGMQIRLLHFHNEMAQQKWHFHYAMLAQVAANNNPSHCSAQYSPFIIKIRGAFVFSAKRLVCSPSVCFHLLRNWVLSCYYYLLPTWNIVQCFLNNNNFTLDSYSVVC